MWKSLDLDRLVSTLLLLLLGTLRFLCLLSRRLRIGRLLTRTAGRRSRLTASLRAFFSDGSLGRRYIFDPHTLTARLQVEIPYVMTSR